MNDSQSQLDTDSSGDGSTLVKHQLVKLGCKPPKASAQRRLLRLANYLDFAALPHPIPKSDLDYQKVTAWGMLNNDIEGDCTIASEGHVMRQLSAANGTSTMPTDAEVHSVYRRLTGGDDTGLVITDAMDDWRTNGLGGNKLGAYAAIDLHSLDMLRAAIYIFGAVNMGVALPKAWQGKKLWQGPTGKIPTSGPWAYNSWGGHCVPAVGFNEKSIFIVSWGDIIEVTNQAIADYFMEAYAMIDSLWLSTAGLSPDGFNIAQLQYDLAIVSGQNPPPLPPPVVPPTPPVVPPSQYVLDVPGGRITWQPAASDHQ